jgi:hypothetical protein
MDFTDWTDERINAEIAKRLGLKPYDMDKVFVDTRSIHYWTEWRDSKGKKFRTDFATSLDAMAEAEATLTTDERRVYIDTLLPDDDDRVPYDECWFYLIAPARVRACCWLGATEGRKHGE